MDRKKITAYLIDCKTDEFMVYRDEAEQGTVAVGPDGKKYRFSVDQLEKTEVLMNDKFMQMTLAEAAAKKPATKKKPAAKPKRKPAKKPGSAPRTA